MFILVHSKGIQSVEGYTSALKVAQSIADETMEKARVYRMPTTVEFVACPKKQIETKPIVTTKKAKRK
jgi:hypothetical protein